MRQDKAVRTPRRVWEPWNRSWQDRSSLAPLFHIALDRRPRYLETFDDLCSRSATSASQVKHDLIPRLGAANQQVAVGRSFEWLWLVADEARNQPAFAGMADPRPARPPHRNIAGLGEFEQALERWIPGNDEATASERDQRPRAGSPVRQVRWEARCVHHARCAGCTRAERSLHAHGPW